MLVGRGRQRVGLARWFYCKSGPPFGWCDQRVVGVSFARVRDMSLRGVEGGPDAHEHDLVVLLGSPHRVGAPGDGGGSLPETVSARSPLSLVMRPSGTSGLPGRQPCGGLRQRAAWPRCTGKSAYAACPHNRRQVVLGAPRADRGVGRKWLLIFGGTPCSGYATIRVACVNYRNLDRNPGGRCLTSGSSSIAWRTSCLRWSGSCVSFSFCCS